jgi:hypothetical protein
MARIGDKKVFCVFEFAKTELIVTVQRRIGTKYHTEPPTDKTIREWQKKFQQSGYLCVVKRTESVKKTPGLQSASELYRPGNYRLSAKSVPTLKNGD